MTKYKIVKKEVRFYYCLFFILNALEMFLELLASRVMSPFFGTSTFVWTAIIGIILLSISLGNYFGGKLSEKKEVPELLSFLLLLCSVSIAIIPSLSELINPFFATANIRLGVTLSSLCLFLLPSIFLSTISPFLMKSVLSQTNHLGETSGKIHSIIAIGSLLGTFAGGFILIPKFGTNHLLYLIASLLLVLAILSIPQKLHKNFLFISICLIVVFLVLTFMPSQENLNIGVSIDTEYSRIIIKDDDINGRTIRSYRSSGAYSSKMFVDNPTELVSKYTQCYNDSFKYNTGINNALMIGGAAYAYPKYWISHTDKKMTVVEIDPMAEKIARKYFNLTDVINEYDENGERLCLLTEDGRVYLNHNNIKYDVIFNDAFSGAIPVGTLATQEAVQHIYNSLTDNGIYMSNILGTLYSEFLLCEMNTINSVFPYVYIYRADKTVNTDYGNYIVVASKQPIEDELFLNADYQNHIILTDDYSPVEQMVGDSYFVH